MRDTILEASAKQGVGIQSILSAIVDRIPAPKGDPTAPLQAMIFDSVFNIFRGIEIYFRIFNGTLRKGDRVQFMHTGRTYIAEEIGILQMAQLPQDSMDAGQVGYLVSGIKDAQEVKVGDTITQVEKPCGEVLKGFEEVKPMVFAGVYPVETSAYEDLRVAMEKLKLNDAALVWEPETSVALGFGFRCGFLGMLHMEIVQERLEREFGMRVISTVPSVQFYMVDKKGQKRAIHSPAEMPDPGFIDQVQEPIMRVQIISKPEYVGGIMKLCSDSRGVLKGQVYLTADRVELSFTVPLAEIVFDFFDQLKSISKGYASLDYELKEFVPSQLVKLDILLNGNKVDALSAIVHRSKAYDMGRKLCVKLKELLPRQQFEIPIQASIGAKIIARETVKAVRKNVTGKCYGGDITRKKKLLEKQKKGKKRMRQVGSVEIPQEAFLAVLQLG